MIASWSGASPSERADVRGRIQRHLMSPMARKGLTTSEVMHGTSITSEIVQAALNEMQKRGEVVQVESNHAPLYRIVD